MLGEFLRAASGKHGAWNCSTDAADWCVALGWPDFAASWRGIVEPLECASAAQDGLVKLWDLGIGDSLPLATAPYQAGDIAVVRRLFLQTGAIFTGQRWALRGERDMAFLTLPDTAILKAWRPWARQ